MGIFYTNNKAALYSIQMNYIRSKNVGSTLLATCLIMTENRMLAPGRPLGLFQQGCETFLNPALNS